MAETGTASNPFAPTEATTTRQPWEGGVDPAGSDLPGSGGQIPWQRGLFDTLVPILERAAKEQGMDAGNMEGWLTRNFSSMVSHLTKNFVNAGFGTSGGRRTGGGSPVDTGSFFTNTPQGLQALTNIALGWVGQRFPGFDPVAGRGGSGGGGGGPRRPTAAEIRAQFDVSQLAQDVSHLTQGYLLQEHEDPRGVARAYVEAIVRNPDQKLDFQTFVVDSLKANPRWATLYKHKPAAINELQYIGQYTNAAQQLLGANRGEDWSGEQFHAMALGADPNAWQERLERSNSYTSQAPFVAKLEARASGLSHILKGS